MQPRLGARIKLIDRQRLTELYELREMLERGAAALAAERIIEKQIDSMRNLAEQYAVLARRYTEVVEDYDDPDVLIERMIIVDVAFHLQPNAVIYSPPPRWLDSTFVVLKSINWIGLDSIGRIANDNSDDSVRPEHVLRLIS
jgi:hypothetical protein